VETYKGHLCDHFLCDNLFSVTFFVHLLKNGTEKCDLNNYLHWLRPDVDHMNRIPQLKVDAGALVLAVQVTNVKATKRLGYCVGITYCERLFLSKRLLKLIEDNFDALINSSAPQAFWLRVFAGLRLKICYCD